MITYGSVCSGIEAASLAWEPLGMQAAWFAEIEKFPSAVLAHRWPHVPNLGDMTLLPDYLRQGIIAAPDILVGGTPCQAFSLAGMRKGLIDPRGMLTIKFVEVANAIDEQRPDKPCVVVWENVPGVLSDKSNAFGCFLAALVGDCEALEPAGGRWSNAGVVLGPQRAAAWRVIDAQYFGVAQRRRRIFVVASAREGFDPTAVLFEREGVRRDTAPCREAWQEVAGNVGTSIANGSAGTCYGIDGEQNVTAGLMGTLRSHQSGGYEGARVAYCMAHGQAGAEIRSDGSPSLTCNHEAPIIAYPIQEVGKRTGVSTNDPRCGLGIGDSSDPMYTLQAGAQHGVAVQSTPIIFNWNAQPDQMNFSSSTPALTCSQGPAVCQYGDVAGGQTTRHDSGPCADRGMNVVAFQQSQSGMRVMETHATLDSNNGSRRHNGVLQYPQLTVRRLMPVECELLQGMPRNHTAIPGAADGPRYKAIGNSKAVPCVAWIGARLAWELLK